MVNRKIVKTKEDERREKDERGEEKENERKLKGGYKTGDLLEHSIQGWEQCNTKDNSD